MVTTFFGPHSFGGDSAYVERLSEALCRRGHEVHVFHCVDAFNAVKGRHPLRQYSPPTGLHVHSLESKFGVLSPLATQATGRPYFKQAELAVELDRIDTDVVHFHNISLVGGPGVLKLGRGAVRVMTAHEHWLVCPMHLLWKYDTKSCDAPTCFRCMLAAGRPPQLWRSTGTINEGLAELDALLFPSRHALGEHERRGVKAPMSHLPYFLPDGWEGPALETQASDVARPYVAAAGRLVKMKGFQQIIRVMKYLPEVDLRLAGTGPFEGELRSMADGLPNVRFEGLLSGRQLAGLFRGSRAVVVPSLFAETFGYVVLEAFAAGAPVIVQKRGGAIFETGVESGGGLGYESDAELLTTVRRLVYDDRLRDRLVSAGRAKREGDWSEAVHMERYLGLIDVIRRGRMAKLPHQLVPIKSDSKTA